MGNPFRLLGRRGWRDRRTGHWPVRLRAYCSVCRGRNWDSCHFRWRGRRARRGIDRDSALAHQATCSQCQDQSLPRSSAPLREHDRCSSGSSTPLATIVLDHVVVSDSEHALAQLVPGGLIVKSLTSVREWPSHPCWHGPCRVRRNPLACAPVDLAWGWARKQPQAPLRESGDISRVPGA
jgi:hypothetical protein